VVRTVQQRIFIRLRNANVGVAEMFVQPIGGNQYSRIDLAALMDLLSHTFSFLSPDGLVVWMRKPVEPVRGREGLTAI
jgi:hypothetical protein